MLKKIKNLKKKRLTKTLSSSKSFLISQKKKNNILTIVQRAFILKSVFKKRVTNDWAELQTARCDMRAAYRRVGQMQLAHLRGDLGQEGGGVPPGHWLATAGDHLQKWQCQGHHRDTATKSQHRREIDIPWTKTLGQVNIYNFYRPACENWIP